MTKQQKKKCPLWPTPSASLESAERKIGSAAVQVCTERCANLENAARKLARDRGQTCTTASANLEKHPPMAGSFEADRSPLPRSKSNQKKSKKSAHIGEVDVNACSSSNTKPESGK